MPDYLIWGPKDVMYSGTVNHILEAGVKRAFATN